MAETGATQAKSGIVEGGGDGGALITKWWVQLAALILLVGFFVLGFLALRLYKGQPPIPERVVSEDGEVLFTAEDIHTGQAIFLENGLMEYGTVLGHGAYLGPDYTADYLHRAAEAVLETKGGGEQEARAEVAAEFKRNTYDPETGTLTFTRDQADAFDVVRAHYADFFGDPKTTNALRPKAITDEDEITQLTAFFAWTSWTASAKRPDKDYSYTNNWPPEELVDNSPSGPVVVWSAISLIALLGGIGALMAIFGRWDKEIGWEPDAEYGLLRLRNPDSVQLTASQKATVFFFLVMALLFLIQTLVGGAAQHYRADPTTFYGLNLAKLLPFNLARTWHLQLAIFWVATSFLASGIFLAPMISRREPRKQHWLVYALLGALAIVVFGSLAGEFFGIHGSLGGVFGNQGFEYLDLGRFWQILLVAGLFIWVAILYRGMRKRLHTHKRVNLPWLFFFTALAIPAFYAIGLVARSGSTWTANDFWRFWVIHLWVEQFLELFTTVMVAYIFVLLGIVSKKMALRLIFLDIIIYSLGGVIGTMHHAYFSGEPSEFMALGAVFSALEIMPLTFLTVEAWRFVRLSRERMEKNGTGFKHYWALMFFIAVGFWNFLGAAVLGFLINLPIVSYYEIGTALTANHGHAAFMGVYGMLAVGLALFCLRYLVPERAWSDRAAKISFWSMNIGLVWMLATSLFPIGVLQLFKSVSEGYFAARSPEFLGESLPTTLEWLRFPGDVLIIVGGALPLLYLCWQGVRNFRKRTPVEEPADQLHDVIEEAGEKAPAGV